MFDNPVFIRPVTASPACYRTQSGECGEPLSKGDCGEREWLVLGQSGVLECEERDCHPELVLIDGLCLDIDHSSNCTGSGNTPCMLLDKHDLLQYSSTLINIPTGAYYIGFNLCNAT